MKRSHASQLYHLSTENHNGEIFQPRVPDSRATNEDDKKRRICFSTTLAGAFRAIYINRQETLYVHVPVNMDTVNNHLWQPSEKEVEDVGLTNERWVRCKCKMKCIGKAKFRYRSPNYAYYLWRPEVRIDWLEKYV